MLFIIDGAVYAVASPLIGFLLDRCKRKWYSKVKMVLTRVLVLYKITSEKWRCRMLKTFINAWACLDLTQKKLVLLKTTQGTGAFLVLAWGLSHNWAWLCHPCLTTSHSQPISGSGFVKSTLNIMSNEFNCLSLHPPDLCGCWTARSWNVCLFHCLPHPYD